jgi:hypothetical protein
MTTTTTNIADPELRAMLATIKGGIVRNKLKSLLPLTPKGKVMVKLWFDKETPRALSQRYTLSEHCSPTWPRDADVLMNKSAGLPPKI